MNKTTTNPVQYDHDLCVQVASSIFSTPAPHESFQHPISIWNALLDLQTPEFIQLLMTKPASQVMYYALMQARNYPQQSIPPHDILLLMTNILSGFFHGKDHLVLLDWELFPAVILASGMKRKSDTKLHIMLPQKTLPKSIPKNSLARVLDTIQQYMPQINWVTPSNREETIFPRNALVVGQDPLAHCENDSQFLKKIASIQGGVFFCSWDFLGVKIHSHTRSFWVNSGLISNVIQLPRPRRQGTAVYPALITLKNTEHTAIRMVQVPNCPPGPGAIDIPYILALLEETGDTPSPNSADIASNDIASNGNFDLSPSVYLSKKEMPHLESGTLRQFAQVLRCQLPRERIDREELPQLDEEEWVGEYDGGSFIGREVSLGELTPLSGFLNEYGGNIVKLGLTRLGKQGKYLLQSGDILFAFRGTQASVGQVGYVDDEGMPGITGQSLCIIRPLPSIDGVWLYYYLQRSAIRKWIQGRASGATLLTINMESIRDIPVVSPSADEVSSINEEHRAIASAMAKISEQHSIIDAARWRIREREDLQIALTQNKGKTTKIGGRPGSLKK